MPVRMQVVFTCKHYFQIYPAALVLTYLLCRIYKCKCFLEWKLGGNVVCWGAHALRSIQLHCFPGGVLHGPGCVQQGRCPQYHGQLWSAQLPPSQGVLPAVWDGPTEPERLQTGSPEASGARTRGYFLLYTFIQAEFTHMSSHKLFLC